MGISSLVLKLPPIARRLSALDVGRPHTTVGTIAATIIKGTTITIVATATTTTDMSSPHRIVLHQKNIEAVCSSEPEVREQIRLTVMHELGHYFGIGENQLKDV